MSPSVVSLARVITGLPQAERTEWEARLHGRGEILRVTVPWLPRPLWLVAGLAEVKVLVNDGITRHHVFTRAEARELLGVDGLELGAWKLLSQPPSEPAWSVDA